jgi:hypothetical protein
MPKYSYWAAAYGHLASYVVMFIISSVLGARYYPIPYRWSRLAGILLVMGASYGISTLIDNCFFSEVALSLSGAFVLKLAIHTVLILIYLVAAWKLIRSHR